MKDFIYQDFAPKTDHIEELSIFNRLRDAIANKIIHYNDIKLKASRLEAKANKYKEEMDSLYQEIADLGGAR